MNSNGKKPLYTVGDLRAGLYYPILDRFLADRYYQTHPDRAERQADRMIDALIAGALTPPGHSIRATYDAIRTHHVTDAMHLNRHQITQATRFCTQHVPGFEWPEKTL